MIEADILRERARRCVEIVMTSEKEFLREFIEAVQIEVHLLEMLACELDSAEEQKKKPPPDVDSDLKFSF